MILIVIPSIVISLLIVSSLMSSIPIFGELIKFPSSDLELNFILELPTIISVVANFFVEPTKLVLVPFLQISS